MCNINALYIKNKTNKITPFLMAVSSHSFATNSHGEGIYIESTDKVFKSKNKMNYFNYQTAIENSKLIITHQRLSTSGFELEYNHPFANDDFVLVHNGVINQFKEDIGSDTYGFWIKFNEEFKKITSHLSRCEKVVKVLKKLFAKDEGSYSILIYDKKTQDSYYFKGDGYPSINFYKNDNYLFITTNPSNDIFLDMIDSNEFKKLIIEDRVIYKISPKYEVFSIYHYPEDKKFEYNRNYEEQDILIGGTRWE